MIKIYFADWATGGYEAMIRDFRPDVDSYQNGAGGVADVKPDEVLFAYYAYENYSGSAFVLFERDGKPFEVNGSHCSCYGLEGQWVPEETTWPALAMRTFRYTFEQEYGDASDDEARAAVTLLVARHSPVQEPKP